MKQSNENSSNMDFCVVISASGRAVVNPTNSLPESRLIHAVSVSQPVQSWTVIRDHIDFIAVGNALSSVISGLPDCPAPPDFETISPVHEMEAIVKSRNLLQNWLTNILLYPGARESPAVR